MHSSPLQLPPMDCLAAAFEAARCGSFSAAAEGLGVTHATISRRVAAAEAWAGISLFERHARGVRLTNEGQRFVTRLSQAFGDIEALVDRSRRPGRSRTSIRISLTASFARYWLLPRLDELEADNVRLDIIAEQRNADIPSGEADMAIRYGRGGWSNVAETPLFDEVLTPIGSASFADVEGNAAAVFQYPLLHSGDTLLWRAWANGQSIPHRNKAADRILADYGLSIDAAQAGHGVALWNRALHPLPQGLRVVCDTDFRAGLRHHLLLPRHQQGDAAAAFVERLLQAAGRGTVSTM